MKMKKIIFYVAGLLSMGECLNPMKGELLDGCVSRILIRN